MGHHHRRIADVPVAVVLVIAVIIVLAGCTASPRPLASTRNAGRSSAPCALPVAAPVADGFRPPDQPWLPGNRGLTFATHPGQPVRSVRAGLVGFSGEIAHVWYVTVVGSDGRDVTYSYLASTPRRTGDPVSVGDVIGVTGQSPFHLGFRDGETYLDPSGLVDAVCPRRHAVLVPVPS